MTSRLFFSLVVGLGLILTSPSYAQDNGALPAAPKPAKSKHARHPKADRVKPAEAKAPEIAPWAAVDPGRATGVTPPPADANAAAVPGVQHNVQPDQDRMSYGVKWSSTNSSANQYSTQGVVNSVNRNLGNPNDLGGTDAEAGMKFHF